MDDSRIAVPAYKVVVLGDSSVGKTSLIHRFASDTFNQHTSNTIGAAFITIEHSSKSKEDRKLKLEIWDTAGQERYKSLTPMYYRNANVALICFDLSNVVTLDKAKYWLEQLLLNSGSQSQAATIKLIGTKQDLIENNETSRVVTDFCEQNHLTFYKTSAKTREGIDALFDEMIDEIDEQFFVKFYENQKQLQDANSKSTINNINFLNYNPSNNRCC
ncbi:uncharacterized protein PRCAT00004438001 [Priceomyces carsonii]|uniref:uncharacterized protein n=1 Tax=Priceomyces carsonii TaxID=28549 RepID=UPI002EDB4CC1|nr:unnamed protein product [Priceomyces carsonii]